MQKVQAVAQGQQWPWSQTAARGDKRNVPGTISLVEPRAGLGTCTYSVTKAGTDKMHVLEGVKTGVLGRKLQESPFPLLLLTLSHMRKTLTTSQIWGT